MIRGKWLDGEYWEYDDESGGFFCEGPMVQDIDRKHCEFFASWAQAWGYASAVTLLPNGLILPYGDEEIGRAVYLKARIPAIEGTTRRPFVIEYWAPEEPREWR